MPAKRGKKPLVEQATAIVSEPTPQKPGNRSSRSGNKVSTQRQLKYPSSSAESDESSKESEDSETDEERAIREAAVPPAPIDFKTTNVGSTTLKFSWTAVTGMNITSYTLTATSAGVATVTDTFTGESTSSGSLSGLVQFTKYSVDLVATDNTGASSTATTVATFVPGLSGPLTDAYISNDVKQLEINSTMRSFVDPNLEYLDVKNYVYCLVDSNSYKHFEEEGFRAFIKSVCYIGRGKDTRCCHHPFVKGPEGFDKKLEIKQMWERGGKLTAVCLISSEESEDSKDMEAHMLEAFGKDIDTDKYLTLWNLYRGTYIGGEDPKVQQNWGVQLLYTAWKVYVDKPVIADMILSYSYATEAIMREETAEQKILKEAKAFGYSKTLTGAFNSSSMLVKHLEKAFPMPKRFYSPTNLSGDVEFYAYCLVDSTLYKSSGKEDFQAFIRSVHYIGKGKGCECFTRPLDSGYSENIWKKGGKWTAVCLGYFSTTIADNIKDLLVEAIGKEKLSISKNAWRYYEGNKTPTEEEVKKQESWGVQLLYTAWKVYVDKPVILEMMLSHPKTYAEAMRASDKRRKLRTAAQECFTAAHECFTAADAQYQAAFDRNEHVVKRYNEASKTFEEKKKSLKEADDKIKGIKIAASKKQVKPKQKQKLQAAMEAAKSKEQAAKSKKQAKRDVKFARLHMNATENMKKKAETDIEEAEKVMAALRIQPGSPT